MQLTQSYSHRSGAVMDSSGMKLDVAAEQSRSPVFLEAQIKDSLAYARAMLALYDVVKSDLRGQQKDHSAYQEWVQQRYLEELSGYQTDKLARVPGLMKQRDELKQQSQELQKQASALETVAGRDKFHTQKYAYFKWLYTQNREAWIVLDPVVSVHPDCLIFEVFSVDESSYGRVTVPTNKLDIFGESVYGTTNIDYSKALADEISRIRSYRPAFIGIGQAGVGISTGAGEAIEKKIDLPPSWVRGFLQVQSASAFASTALTLSASTVAEVLSVLRRRREDKGPRSLRFTLATGQKPTITIEPWNVVIAEPDHVYTGAITDDVRIWGRRRLFTLEKMLPYAEKVDVRLLGSGMPSYWTVFQADHRFDLGLSGWTKNDWASAARFDLLSATAGATEGDIASAAKILESKLLLTPETLAAQSDLSRESALSALQKLCADGRAMYDPNASEGAYRWRPLLPVPIVLNDESDKRLQQARKIIEQKTVKWLNPTNKDESGGFGKAHTEEPVERVRANAGSEGGKAVEVVLEVDRDGRVQFASCACGWFRREKLRRGPCQHILAVAALASEQIALQIADRKSKAATPTGPRPDLFQGQTFVFTGALTIYTREQAEELVRQAGGTASGSVSKNTTYLVAGGKAGSKLAKANQLKVPVLTEAQFKAMVEAGA